MNTGCPIIKLELILTTSARNMGHQNFQVQNKLLKLLWPSVRIFWQLAHWAPTTPWSTCFKSPRTMSPIWSEPRSNLMKTNLLRKHFVSIFSSSCKCYHSGDNRTSHSHSFSNVRLSSGRSVVPYRYVSRTFISLYNN